ncbi:hypothetical protein AHAS_Ahas17G0062300 [Arachis hypogaea]
MTVKKGNTTEEGEDDGDKPASTVEQPRKQSIADGDRCCMQRTSSLRRHCTLGLELEVDERHLHDLFN